MNKEDNLTTAQALIVWGIIILAGISIAGGLWGIVLDCPDWVFKKSLLLALAIAVTDLIVLTIFCIYNAATRGKKR